MQCDFELDGILLHTCVFSGFVSEETGTSCEDEDMGTGDAVTTET